MKNNLGLVREDVISVGNDLKFPPLTEAQINIVLSRVDAQADSDPTGNWRVWVENILYDVVPKKPTEKKFKVGDKVRTSTHAVYQNTQETLNDLTGVIMNTDDYPYNIHVKIDKKPTWGNIGFSEFELTKIDVRQKITIELQFENGQKKKNEEIQYLLFQPRLLQIDDEMFSCQT